MPLVVGTADLFALFSHIGFPVVIDAELFQGADNASHELREGSFLSAILRYAVASIAGFAALYLRRSYA